MREGWKSSKVGDVCTVIAGQSPKGEAYNDKGDGLPFYQGKKHFGDIYVRAPTTWTREVTKEADSGDILMSVRAPVGPVNFAIEKACIGRGLAAIRASENIDRMFLFYWLLFKQDDIKGNEGAVFPSINKKQIEDIELFVPPLPEQKRIVAILDEAFAGIDTAVANTERNLANARELFESYLNSVFSQRGDGWIEQSLSKFVNSVSTGPFGSLLHKSDYVSEGVPLVNPINIVGEVIVPDGRKMIGNETKGRLQSYVLKAGDVVIARRGEIGRCAVVSETQRGWVCGTGCFFIRPLEAVNPHFLAPLLRSAQYRKELERLSSGATMLNLSNKALSNLRVSMPDVKEQNKIVDRIVELREVCQEIESIYQQKLAALAELKQSLLQKAFSGELTASKEAANAIRREAEVA